MLEVKVNDKQVCCHGDEGDGDGSYSHLHHHDNKLVYR